MAYRLWIPGPLPGLNEVLSAKGASFKTGYNGYSALKREWTEIVSNHAKEQGFPTLEAGHFVYLWREPTKRRDPSNVAAGGRKIIEDALQAAKLIPGDGWAQVLSFQDHFLVDKEKPGVSVFVTHVRQYRLTGAWEKDDNEWDSRHALLDEVSGG